MAANRKNFLYISMVVLLILIATVAVLLKSFYSIPSVVPNAVAKIPGRVAHEAPKEPVVYEIDEVGASKTGGGAPVKSVEPADINDIYRKFPKENAGANMAKAWSSVEAEDKASTIEELDKKIEEAKEKLKTNPSDKSAKNLMMLSEALKTMAVKDFNLNKEEMTSLENELSEKAKNS